MAMNTGALRSPHVGITADVDAAIAAKDTLRLKGFAARESASTPAVAAFDIVAGATGNAGALIVPVELAANGCTFAFFEGQGIDAREGLSINLVAGEVDVTLFYESR